MYDCTSCVNFFVHLAAGDAFTLLTDCI